jgi:hypothetical protein
MKRRNLFRLALCAVAASAMEVTGWAGVAAKAPDAMYETRMYFHPEVGKIFKVLYVSSSPFTHPDKWNRVGDKWVKVPYFISP